MSDTHEIEASTRFTQVMLAAAKLPGVRIHRATYLRKAFQRYCTDEQIEQAIAETPAKAGIPLKTIQLAAATTIQYETGKATALSAAAGIPGGFAMLGTVPADMAQFMGHVLRVAQKLAYIYSWPDLFTEDGEALDEATENMLTLFVGVMFGAGIAEGGVAKVADMIAANALKKLPQKALTKGLIYPIVKKVAAILGQKMTKQIFAEGIAKLIPVAGAVLSGALTLVSFLPMSKRLQDHLASLELTKPDHRTSDTDVIDVEVIDEVAEDVPQGPAWNESGRDAGEGVDGFATSVSENERVDAEQVRAGYEGDDGVAEVVKEGEETAQENVASHPDEALAVLDGTDGTEIVSEGAAQDNESATFDQALDETVPDDVATAVPEVVPDEGCGGDDLGDHEPMTQGIPEFDQALDETVPDDVATAVPDEIAEVVKEGEEAAQENVASPPDETEAVAGGIEEGDGVDEGCGADGLGNDESASQAAPEFDQTLDETRADETTGAVPDAPGGTDEVDGTGETQMADEVVTHAVVTSAPVAEAPFDASPPPFDALSAPLDDGSGEPGISDNTNQVPEQPGVPTEPTGEPEEPSVPTDDTNQGPEEPGVPTEPTGEPEEPSVPTHDTNQGSGEPGTSDDTNQGPEQPGVPTEPTGEPEEPSASDDRTDVEESGATVQPVAEVPAADAQWGGGANLSVPSNLWVPADSVTSGEPAGDPGDVTQEPAQSGESLDWEPPTTWDSPVAWEPSPPWEQPATWAPATDVPSDPTASTISPMTPATDEPPETSDTAMGSESPATDGPSHDSGDDVATEPTSADAHPRANDLRTHWAPWGSTAGQWANPYVAEVPPDVEEVPPTDTIDAPSTPDTDHDG